MALSVSASTSRRLNQMTKKDAFPLPRMQETMESMVGARHFSCMDLKSGFWAGQDGGEIPSVYNLHCR